MATVARVSPHLVTRPFDADPNCIPWVVSELIDVLADKKAHEFMGIFRPKCEGPSAEMLAKELLKELDSGFVPDYSKYNARAVACALKMFFRLHIKVEDPLIPFELHDEMMHAIPNGHMDKTDAIMQLRTVVGKLSRGRQATLCYFMSFLSRIAEHSDVNYMKAGCLGIVTSSCIIEPLAPDYSLLMWIYDRSTKIVEMMIEHRDEIFADVEITSDSFMKGSDIQLITRSVNKEVYIDQIRKRWKYRSGSLIPYVPAHLLNDPTFKRPTEPYEL